MFLQQFLVCMIAVGIKLVSPGFHPLSCTAEELAVFAMKRCALASLDNAVPEDAFNSWDDIVLEDLDHELLYSPCFDGIESDEDAIREFGFAHLATGEWFMPFASRGSVSPYLLESADYNWDRDAALYDEPLEDEDEDG